jgi:putative lipoic acid-binding regulatory protein
MAEDNDNDNDADSSAEDDQTKKEEAPAGSFFHPVPPPSDESSSSIDDTAGDATEATAAPKSADDEFNDAINQLIQQRRKKPLASQPSTINGVPTATGFGKPKPGDNKKSKKKPINPYVAIGTPDQPINNPSKPERDDQGYTLYTDTETGEKSRVFEALVDYPSIFTMKIVGANEGTFVQEMVVLVAEACDTEVDNVKHSTKVMGKWVSVTVKAPVQSAEMLYSLYEKVDLDPRVKFKF